jgi:hypothetical protein
MEKQMTVPITPKKKRNCTTRNRPSGLKYQPRTKPTIRSSGYQCKKTVDRLQRFENNRMYKMFSFAFANKVPVNGEILFCIPKGKHTSLKKIRKIYGDRALTQFKNFFKTTTKKPMFDNSEWSKIKRAVQDPEMQEKLRKTCFYWIWAIKPSMVNQAFKLYHLHKLYPEKEMEILMELDKLLENANV